MNRYAGGPFPVAGGEWEDQAAATDELVARAVAAVYPRVISTPRLYRRAGPPAQRFTPRWSSPRRGGVGRSPRYDLPVSLNPWWVRLVTPASAVVFLVVALAIRAFSGGALEQYSGTALYASIVYATVVFLWPPVTPLVAGGITTGFCWLVEVAQLTPVPAALSARSLLARFVLGVQFDPTDLAWYPVGVVPLVALHWLIRVRARNRTPATAPV